MCTAIVYDAIHRYFGRNLDLERTFDESVTVTPRRYPFRYKCGETDSEHYAMIGMSTVMNDYPLYYEATNEHGLSMAGLNFVGNAYLSDPMRDGSVELAPYELIPYVLGRYRTVSEAEEALKKIRLVDIPFFEDVPNSQLHWMIADRERCIVVEIVRDGTNIYEDPVGVLTNNPPFDYQMMNLNNYMALSAKAPQNNLSSEVNLSLYSRGMGALGLPGDASSMSRFVRAAFTRSNSAKPSSEDECVSQMLHILASVAQVEGTVEVNGGYERTQYSSCCNIESGVYYYRTYGCSQINAVRMFNEDLGSDALISYKMITSENIKYVN